MEKACVDINNLIPVFSNTSGTIYQSDKLNCFFIDFGGKFARLNQRNLKRLKQVVEQVDIEEKLLDHSGSDIEIITFNGCEHIYILNILEIIALKDLLQGTFVMFRLNHLINDCLFRLAA